MNREQLLLKYQQGQRDFSQLQLGSIDLSHTYLAGISFNGADLSTANLYGANLLRADLRNAILRRANLSKAVLIGSRLDGACLERANLDDTLMPNNRTTYSYRVKPEKKAYARQMRNNPTPSEAALWERLRRNQLGVKIGRQRVILGYIADFYCADCRLVIEVDGGSHADRHQEDALRDTALLKKGFRTLRFPADRVLSDPDGVVALDKESHQEELGLNFASQQKLNPSNQVDNWLSFQLNQGELIIKESL
jgi:very-short-patch-repair endonuclease